MTDLEKEKFHTRKRGEKLFNFRPLFFAAFFLCLGILFFYYHHVHGLSFVWLFLLVPILLFPFLFCSSWERVYKTLLAVLLLLTSFFCGGWLFDRQIQDFTAAKIYKEEVFISGKVVKITENDHLSCLYLEDLNIDGKREEGELIAYLPTSFIEKYSLSDRVLLRGKVQTNTKLFDWNGFRASAIGDGLRFSCYAQWMEKTEEEFDLFLLVRQRMSDVLHEGMSKDAAPVVMGMLLGDTSGIEEGLYKNIRYGGVAHIFAVSGLHVGALFGFCLLIIGRIKNSPKFFRWILVAVVLFFYAGVCGYSESVVRAMVICLVFYAFRLFNLQSDFLEGLGVAAIIVLVRNPVALFDIGCQLSFGACMGIAFVSSPMQRSINAWFDGKRKKAALLRGEEEVSPPGIATRFRRAFVSFFTVTLGAQIFTLPIMLSSFSYVSVWALALNCFFTPFISAIFSFLLLFVFLACCFPILFSRVLLFIPNLLISFSMLLFEVTDFSTLSISFVIPISLNLSYYTAVLLASDKFNLKKGYKWAMVSVCFLAFVVTVFALNM